MASSVENSATEPIEPEPLVKDSHASEAPATLACASDGGARPDLAKFPNTFAELRKALIETITIHVPDDFFPAGASRHAYVEETLAMRGERSTERARDFLRHLAGARLRGTLNSYDLAAAASLCILARRDTSNEVIPTIVSGVIEVLARDRGIYAEATACIHSYLRHPTKETIEVALFEFALATAECVTPNVSQCQNARAE